LNQDTYTVSAQRIPQLMVSKNIFVSFQCHEANMSYLLYVHVQQNVHNIVVSLLLKSNTLLLSIIALDLLPSIQPSPLSTHDAVKLVKKN